MTCPDCERYKLSAAMWRNEAYKQAGTPLPWEPEELLRKEYERGYAGGVMAERQRIVNLLMIQHEAAKGAHNYWHVAAQLIQADVASDT